MVTKSFDWIDEVQATVVAGVENGTQKLERTRDRNKRKVGARDAETRRNGFENVAKESQRLL
jgi:hypothetical protein